MRLQGSVLVLLAFGLVPEARGTSYATQEDFDREHYRDLASHWMSGFLSLRVRTNDERYDEVIKELMKVQCAGADVVAAIDNTPVVALLPLYAWDDSLELRCGCFVNGRDVVACGAIWNSPYLLRK